jgi:hypothetical protein
LWELSRVGEPSTKLSSRPSPLKGILAFAERILPRASDLWVQASVEYKQRLQQLFFPEGIAYDGNRFNRTAATTPLFNYLAPSESAAEKVVSLNFTSWNRLDGWLRVVDALRQAAAPKDNLLRVTSSVTPAS